MKPSWKYLIGFLVIITVLVWLAALSYPGNTLKLIACDVGQGDAILAQVGHQQLLIDGGPGGKVTECLSRHMPFWDRTVEAVLMTHPEKDHYFGLIKVLENYKVKYFLTSGLDSDSQEFGVLKNEVGSGGVSVLRVRQGQSIRVGLMYLDILHPSDKFIAENSVGGTEVKLTETASGSAQVLGAFSTKKNKNDFSVVTILSYGEFDALMTGDIEDAVSDLIARELSADGQRVTTNHKFPIEYLKVPHHGSKNGLSQKLVDVLNPQVAVISLGKDNSYGHPHREVLDILGNKKIKILRTDQEGDLVVETDGKGFWLSK